MTNLVKALKFYQLIKAKYSQDKDNSASYLPERYISQSIKEEFHQQFSQLDPEEQEQWFDHLYKECVNIMKSDSPAHRPAREIILLLLSTCTEHKLKLAKDYDFGSLIRELWITKFRGKEEENLRKAYEDSGYALQARTRSSEKSTISCGCLKSDSCDIF